MNILFLLKNYTVGGVEVVTQVLANRFIADGHNVSIASFETPPTLLTDWLNKSVDYLQLEPKILDEKNKLALKKYVDDKTIDVIINQWGLPYQPIKLASKSINKKNTKLISVQHNVPDFNERIGNIDIQLQKTKSVWKKYILLVKRRLFYMITSKSMKYVYEKSDTYLLLSESFIPIFKNFTKIFNPSKLSVLTNPLTIDNSQYIYNRYEKEKEIIYVGRIDFNQKRVHRIIEIWEEIFHRFPDWKLTIIGDGISKETLKTYIFENQVKNIEFVGFQPPINYYKRASILLLTSEYEGFPLVIPEAMSFGVVPVVYGSYSAAYDAIDNGRDGFVIPKNSESFNKNDMIKNIEYIIINDDKRNDMALKAIEKSSKFSIDQISKQWYQLFNILKSK